MTKIYMLMDSFFCQCTFTEDTYRPLHGKCARFPIFHIKAKILIIFSNKTFYEVILKKYTLLSMICGKYLELLQKCWTGVTFGHLS